MLLFAKLAGILILVWFYVTGKKHGEPPIKWAIIGLIGYWLTWWAVKLTAVDGLSGVMAKSAAGTFVLIQIPAIVGIAAAYLIRNKLINDSKND